MRSPKSPSGNGPQNLPNSPDGPRNLPGFDSQDFLAGYVTRRPEDSPHGAAPIPTMNDHAEAGHRVSNTNPSSQDISSIMTQQSMGRFEIFSTIRCVFEISFELHFQSLFPKLATKFLLFGL